MPVLGTEEFNVDTIDPCTIRLTREGVKGDAAPIRWSYEDVATPFTGELCDCHDLNGDEYVDLTLNFDSQELVRTLKLNKEAGNTIPLTLTGNLKEENGGTSIEGKDCIWIMKQGKKPTTNAIGTDYITANEGPTTDSSATFTDLSTAGDNPITNWSWVFDNGQKKNKSIILEKSTHAEYKPTSFNFSDSFSVNFTNKWKQDICSRNMEIDAVLYTRR